MKRRDEAIAKVWPELPHAASVVARESTAEDEVMGERRGGRKNWAQVRASIDAGRTRDKIKVLDPATAALGTDAEAGGASTSPEDVARSADQEAAGGPETASGDGAGTGAARRDPGPALLLAGGGVILALVVVLLLLTV